MVEIMPNLDELKISVVDSGIGIKDIDKKKLFKLFGFLHDSK